MHRYRLPGGLAPLLGGLSAERFLARHWQRSARLIRDALPRAGTLVSRERLFELAGRDDVESRIVRRDAGRWTLLQGPFSRRMLAAMPARGWTLLVQGVNQYVEGLDRLLDRFAFVPYARLDDVMVSYAAPGGGVAPHFDSYDVFLLQSHGRRRWRTSAQRDLDLRPRLPLKILARFDWTEEHILAPGDMLYLPPAIAHDGVALDECITCSIGFRAPSAEELVREVLAAAAESFAAPARYRDPGLRIARHPGELPATMIDFAVEAVRRVRLDRAALAPRVGAALSTPKPNIVFQAPPAPLARTRFARALVSRQVRLDPRSILLYDARRFYLNGEIETVPAAARRALRRLADRRELPPSATAPAALVDVLHAWYRAGYLRISSAHATTDRPFRAPLGPSRRRARR